MTIGTFDKVSERLIGWGCIVGAVTEYYDPLALALTQPQAAGLGVFGFLIATGRAGMVARRIGALWRD